MLLQRLIEHQERTGGASPPMYAPTRVKYAVLIDQGGSHPSLITLSGSDGGPRDRGLEMFAPTLVRSVAIKPKLLVDNGEYALGWSREGGDPTKVAARHASFVELIRECAQATESAEVDAVARFFDGPGYGALNRPDDFDPTANVTFQVGQVRPIDDPLVQEFWAQRMGAADDGAGDERSQCLACGRLAPTVERLQFKIKGIPGGQASGTSLISANADAFESYGLKASRVAPICSSCAESFSKALNNLLAGPRTHTRVGNAVYVYWTRDPDSFSAGSFLEDPQPEQVDALISSVHRGAQGLVGDLNPNSFYAVALAASGGRVAVRDWIDTTVGEVQRNLARYFILQRLIRSDGSASRPFGLYSLVHATVRDGSRDDAPLLVGRSLLRLALAGGSLPLWLLAAVLRRIRADQAVTPARVALIKMVLLSRESTSQEEELVELDTETQSVAYRCGRLLAVLDNIQYAALGQRNATIIDRFFGTASTAPASVFPRLVRGAAPHLAKLRSTRRAAYNALDGRLCDIMAGIDAADGFPRTLTVAEQGFFVLGFYHQRAADAKARLERRGSSLPAEELDDEELATDTQP